MKQNKKGFTLIELIVSIALLALIGVSIGIYLNKVNKNREDSEYESYLNKVKSAANVYMSGNKGTINELESNRAYVILSLKELKNNGLIDSKLVDPRGAAGDDIKISLDANGSLVVEYPTTKTNDFLKLDDVKIKLNQGEQTVSCFDLSEVDTLKFGYITTDGILKQPYFKNNNNMNSNIKCNQESGMLKVDTNKVGTYSIKYDYQTQDGVWKSATRKIIVGDSVPPIIKNVTVTPNGWFNNSKTIKATIVDEDSGIGAYTIKKGEVDCNSTTYTGSQRKAKVELDISATASENGKYTICAKDVSDNVQTTVVDVSQIDKFVPKVTNITSNQGGHYNTAFTITATATDDYNGVTSGSVSKIVAYQFTTSSRVPTSGWISVESPENDKQITRTFNATSNTTYYFWVKDAAGNVNTSNGASITINKIGIQKITTVSEDKLYNSTINGNTHSINGMVEYISGSANYGTFNKASNSGSTLYVYGTARDYVYSYTCTKYTDAEREDAIASDVCTKYECNNGGDPDSIGWCRAGYGQTFGRTESGNCHCAGSGWLTGCDTNYICLDRKNYERTTTTYWTNTESHGRISYDDNGDQVCKDLTAYGRKTDTAINTTWECTWQGDYKGDCTSSYTKYSCSGYRRKQGSNERYCYYCANGNNVDADYECPYNGTCYDNRYEYEYIINYWVKG